MWILSFFVVLSCIPLCGVQRTAPVIAEDIQCCVSALRITSYTSYPSEALLRAPSHHDDSSNPQWVLVPVKGCNLDNSLGVLHGVCPFENVSPNSSSHLIHYRPCFRTVNPLDAPQHGVVVRLIYVLLRFLELPDRDRHRQTPSCICWDIAYTAVSYRLRLESYWRLLKMRVMRSLYLRHDFHFMFIRAMYGHKHLHTPKNIQAVTTGDRCDPSGNVLRMGGGSRSIRCLMGDQLIDYVVRPNDPCVELGERYRYHFYTDQHHIDQILANNEGSFATQLPLSVLCTVLTRPEMISVGRIHHISQSSKLTNTERREKFACHYCAECERHLSVFIRDDSSDSRRQMARIRSKKNRKLRSRPKMAASSERIRPDYSTSNITAFPPEPPSQADIESIIRGFCEDTDASKFEETPCSVCAQLCLGTEIGEYSALTDEETNILRPRTDVCVRERHCSTDPIKYSNSPLRVLTSDKVCTDCRADLSKGVLPRNALANGLWIGDQPVVLKRLTFAEQLLVARVRHNRCLVRVSSGRAKMAANCIMYANPTPKIYRALPPSPDELADVLAFVFLGVSRPTDAEFKRTPMLVRRKVVLDALNWLKLNHADYYDLDISYSNLDKYPEEGLPVVVEYREIPDTDGNKIASMTSVHDNDVEEGTEDGPCPFTVHGLTGEEYETLSIQALKLKALKHLDTGGSALGVGHSENPESMYDNPKLYPQMFPWLFPYGYGGIGQPRHRNSFSETQHRRWLLQYYDKRFQTDLYFPIVAFNHQQIKSGTTGSFLLTKRQNFNDIATRLLNVNPAIMASISERLKNGEKITDATDDEKACFRLLDDLDHVGGHVQGSLTSKKYMRNEIWSLISFKGAPSWFITFSPADVKHPICLHLAGTGEKFFPQLKSSKERNLLIMSNPVAAAKFFDYMARMFIKHVLNWDPSHSPDTNRSGVHRRGLYGDTSAFYGTVEQQGRLTLHMHMMLWIENAISPQDIRDRIMSGDSEFQNALIAYLEGCHTGHFVTGSMSDVASRIPSHNGSEGLHSLCKEDDAPASRDPSYRDPTQTMPEVPPPPCSMHEVAEESCDPCQAIIKWRSRFNQTVDDLLYRSNVHKCRASKASKDKELGAQIEGTSSPKGCLTKDGICAARFPREVHDRTHVDATDGHIFLKKLEPMMNTFTPCLTYVMRCNTDVSSLLSGTSIKAIISYVTDYITKPALKTYQIFSSAYDIFDTNSELIGGDTKLKEKARKLILKIVNSLGPKMEIGSPAACMYLLGNPDHYTSHVFVPFWWRSYVREVDSFWLPRSSSPQTSPPVEPNCEANVTDSRRADDQIPAPEDEKEAEDKVMISLEEGRVVARSIVDDYKHRPFEYDNLNLYEWIQCSTKRRMPKRCTKNPDDPDIPGKSKYSLFRPEHPQFSTHYVTCDVSRVRSHIPTFIGGSPPRSDMGDREFYCMTMLTIFKPWRSPDDLKTCDTLWDQAFLEHDFHGRYLSIMRNMGLKYECLDARDDYHAEMKRKTSQATNTSNVRGSRHASKAEFDPSLYKAATDADAINPDGSNHSRLLSKMVEAASIMRRVGLLAEGAVSDTYLVDRFSPKDAKSPAGWKSVVKEARASVLKEKLRHAPAIQSSRTSSSTKPYIDEVTVVSAEYFKHDFAAKRAEHAEILNSVVTGFDLNKEQERAFRIISNHATCIDPSQLLMYLGGMGGTGKTQVIKALIRMFELKKESHRFIVLGPTGTSAALLNGSTYHSALGVTTSSAGKGDDNGPSRVSAMTIAELRERLAGVEYVFIDEVSMIACHELYAISARLATVRNVDDKPFGGTNVILAGDFAQLPPTGGKSLYNGLVKSGAFARQKPRDQENLIGRLIWHQFTTVVILKQNMRQKTQTPDDNKLRTALENMRYAACTKEDVAFIRTRIVGSGPSAASLSDPDLRNVSIITAWNAQKDKINDLGSRRFARDTNQELMHFVSSDTLLEDNTYVKPHSSCPKYMHLTLPLKTALWNAPPCTSDHIPGKLSLCVGMPVMIRHNDATELCITKGQEGIVRGWNSSLDNEGNHVLDTLFVQLLNPPKNINLQGLPENIVPISKSATKVRCELPNDRSVNVQRHQVVVLPNFAMTDYASQGKTRPKNVVDLTHCKHHQSYYTCLSRSSTASGTVILQGFSEAKITKGISGYLRQEFRNLEILNEITRLRYEGTLSPSVKGCLRNTVIRSFRAAYTTYVEKIDWHPQLAANNRYEEESSNIDDPLWNENVTYQDLYKRRKENGQGKTQVAPKKRKADVEGAASDARSQKKQREVVAHASDSGNAVPIGLTWDAVNHSCAYDSLFTSLYTMWLESDCIRRFFGLTDVTRALGVGFQSVTSGDWTFEYARDRIRYGLHRTDRLKFPRGPVDTNLNDLMTGIFGEETYAEVKSVCRLCSHETGELLVGIVTNILPTASTPEAARHDIASRLGRVLDRQVRRGCRQCRRRGVLKEMRKHIRWADTPPILVLENGSHNQCLVPNAVLTVVTGEAVVTTYIVAGLIYNGNGHFVARVIDKQGAVWYHDGITTRSKCQREGTLNDGTVPTWLRTAQGKQLVYTIYKRSEN